MKSPHLSRWYAPLAYLAMCAAFALPAATAVTADPGIHGVTAPEQTKALKAPPATWAAHDPTAHDYIEARSAEKIARITFPGNPCGPCWGDRVSYTSFSQPVQTFDAQRYDGRWITLLIPVTHPRSAEVTEDRLRVLVDRLDLMYASYRELLDWEPGKSSDPLGKQVFTVLPNEPSTFYGLAFAPGDASEYSNAVLSERALDDDMLSNVWVHELGHNFDAIQLWDYGPDAVHDWTTLLQVWFARRQAHMDEVGRQTWPAFEASWLGSYWSGFRDNPSVTWQQCAATSPRPTVCNDARALFLTGNLGVEIGKYISGAQMKSWLQRALQAQNNGAAPATPEERSDYMLSSLAEATQTDTRCIATRFHWYQGSGLAIAAQYPNRFAGCLDSDTDSAQRFDDCNDQNAAVRPGAAEIIDGLDNDCDSLIDEVSVSEANVAGADFGDNVGTATQVGAAPLILSGTFADRASGQALDVDHVRLQTPIAAVVLKLCATGVRTSVAGLATNGIGYGPLAAVDPGQCTTNAYTDQTWAGFWLDRGTVNVPGSYTLEISAPTATWPRPPVITLGRAADGRVRANIDPARVPGGLAGSELRWLQTGTGWVKMGPATTASSLDAPALAATSFASAQPVQLRAQLWRDGLPIEEPANPYLYPSVAHVNGVLPNAGHSGAWYAPSHNGEGFLLEMLPGDRFAVYWFTYDPGAWSSTVGSAAQHWLLAEGAVDGKVLRAPLLRVTGGRFGSAMNPAELIVSSVGELELSFADNQRGTVHFRVDGRTGEFALQRLTAFRSDASTRGLSGSWYQNSLRGQGLIVQELDRNELLGFMFTFDAQRKPAWILVQGNVAADGSISMSSAPFRSFGGLFGRGYRNASIRTETTGTAALGLSCRSGSFQIQVPAIAAASQSFTLERLTTPLGVVCP